MDLKRFNKLYRINSADLSEKHTKERKSVLSDFARRNTLNSGPAVKALSKKSRDEIKDHSEIYISSLSECIDKDSEVNQDERNKIVSMYGSFIRQLTNNRIEILKSRLVASNLFGIVSDSILNGFKQIVNSVQQIGIDKITLMVDDINLKYKKHVSNQSEGINYMENSLLEKNNGWKKIEHEYDISKRKFGRKINFIKDKFKRDIIFRDIEHAYVLASLGFSKPALILAGGVIEELLRQYLAYNEKIPKKKTFEEYIKCCEDNGLLKSAISKLSDSGRQFRNLVHIARERSKKHTISKATAKGIVSSIFTIANDF